MVWEQGCVVIVMLTRLVENDVVLCHRYWPEEGSELYHIYEVNMSPPIIRPRQRKRKNPVASRNYISAVFAGAFGERTHLVR